MDSGICQTSTASPAQPGGLPFVLERAYVQHDGGVASTKWDPLLENLRGDPRYIAFLKKLRLPL